MRASDRPLLEWDPLSKKGRPGLVTRGKDGPEGSRMGLVAQLLAGCHPACVTAWVVWSPRWRDSWPCRLMRSFPPVVRSGESRALPVGVTRGSARNVSLYASGCLGSYWPFPSTHLTLT